MSFEEAAFTTNNEAHRRSWKRLIGKRSLVITGVILIALVSVVWYMNRNSNNSLRQIAGIQANANNDNRINVNPPLAAKEINKTMEFPISGQPDKSLKYLIQNAELRNEIIVNGQKATAVKGRTFLILNIKLTNDSNQNIGVNTRDFIRLSVDDNPDLLAPDIHNDPVEVQAISTKYTRVGFAVNDNSARLKILIGEINGDKTPIDINF